MSFGEKAMKGQNRPAPLPMFQPVALRHVPTMVTRRYDSDLDQSFKAAIQGVPSKDSRSEGSDVRVVKDVNPTFASSNVDDSAEIYDNEAESKQMECDTLAKFDTNQDTQTCSSTQDLGPSASMPSKEGRRESSEEAKDVNPIFASSDIHVHDGIKKYDNEARGTQMEGDTHAKFDTNQDTQTCSTEDFGPIAKTTMTFGNDAMKDYSSSPPLPMYHCVTLKHLPTIIRSPYGIDLQECDASEDLGTEDINEYGNEYTNPPSMPSDGDKRTLEEVNTPNQDVLVVGIVIFLVFIYLRCH